MGALRGQARPGLRALIYRNYASYYRIDKHHVVIVRVLHGSRDMATLAEQGGFEG